MVSFTRDFAHLSLQKAERSAAPPSHPVVSAPAPPPPTPRGAFTPPQQLACVADVVRVTSEEPLVCVYFFAQWCGTCKRVDPLYAYVAQSYASAPILFTSFDCGGEEEKASEDAFDLAYVPTWKMYKGGECVATIEGDWTTFEPLLRDLAGLPTDDVVVSADDQTVLDDARERLARVSEAIKKAKANDARRKARGEDSDSDSETDESASESESSDEEEAGTLGD